MDFNLPPELTAYLDELDRFIEEVIQPLEQKDDNVRFFDHRREWARTDYDKGGLPRPEWEALLGEAKRLADEAGHLRFPLPRKYGGQDGSHLAMTVIREHLAARGLGLHNDLQNEHSIVANNPFVLMFRDFGTPSRKTSLSPACSAAPIIWPSASPNRTTARTRPIWKPARYPKNGTAKTAGGSTVARCGSPACMWRATA